jgi:molybdopterin synthase catalytic subunit/molybdopterin converting factor small subunit
MNNITIYFFATFKEHTGVKSTTITLDDGVNIERLKLELKIKFPVLTIPLDSALIAVNRRYAFDDDVLPDGAEVAIFPPVSGGGYVYPTIVMVTEEEISQDNLIEKVTLATTGAVCSFVGTVRNITEREHPHQTEFLEYESYKPMAELKMLQVANEIRNRWANIEGIVIVQRLGRLYPGTPTVIIACSAAHRDTGIFDAVHYGIDRLKEIVPVWKKEIGSLGETWVEGDYFPSQQD